ncbi:hypothetical protein BDV96DRAFT_198910 [Lophiotrema nucula]|uniref:Uncharacterized protein n=1 Tax=Lophiotrema nucula TaxID=690887 RepID=A0A6A5YUB6_9PLEO|nr:hypothetical protein BDV96DRAFT_198910 [Lophiotrema nucula]
MPAQPGLVRRLWLQWKTLQLPWRKQWLAGFDLEGNTYWEFKDVVHALRNRRIVKYARWTHHGDVNVPPQWMQWLRHTRFEPPSINEQRADVFRREQMKVLAAEADARWASKPSAMDAPDKQQPAHMLESRDVNSGIRQANVDEDARDSTERPRTTEEVEATPQAAAEAQESKETPVSAQGKVKTPKESPWKQPPKGGPGEEWQPESWSPAPARRRG